MKTRPWRLRTQISLLVLGVIVVAQAVSLWFFVDERTLAVQAAIGAEAAGRAANVAQLIEGAPPELHPQIIRAATSPLIRFNLTEEPEVVVKKKRRRKARRTMPKIPAHAFTSVDSRNL